MSRVNSGTDTGPVLGATSRSPLWVALDLWRARGSFRGFAEFALIGAVVLAFLPGSPFGVGGARQAASSGAPAAAELPRPATAAMPLAPGLSDVAFDARYFDDVAEPLRAQLAQALTLYRQRRIAEAERVLLKAPGHPKVLLMRGLDALATANREALAAGIGLLERAVAQGEPRAMAILGVIKVAGTPGYPRDTAGGRDLIERAVTAGDAAAARVAGEGFLSGWMGMVDPARARHFLQTASDRGDTLATFRLGEMLEAGHGVPRDEVAAERLFVKAAAAGHVEALALLGVRQLVQFGQGLTDNPDQALRLLELAAAQNQPNAMYYLGMFYVEYGRRIGRLDLPRGLDLFRRCAEAALAADCAFAYAGGLELGLGAARDPVRAYAMYVVAAADGKASKAQGKRDELARLLSGDEMARANAIVTQTMQNARSTPAASAGTRAAAASRRRPMATTSAAPSFEEATRGLKR